MQLEKNVDRLNRIHGLGKQKETNGMKTSDSTHANNETPKKDGWWKKKSDEEKVWFLYVMTAVVSITIVYMTPEAYASNSYVFAGIFVLAMLHLVIWPLYTKKTSVVTKIVISAILTFFITAVILPKSTKSWVAEVKASIMEFDAKKHTTPASTVVATAPQANQVSAKVTEPKFILVKAAQATFTEVKIPETKDGRIPPNMLFSAECPSGVQMAVVTDANPQGNVFEDCSKPINLPKDLSGVRIGFMSPLAPAEIKFWYVSKS